MSGRVLLDTNIIIAIFAEEPPVLERMAAAEEVFVPAVALGFRGSRSKSGEAYASAPPTPVQQTRRQ